MNQNPPPKQVAFDYFHKSHLKTGMMDFKPDLDRSVVQSMTFSNFGYLNGS